MNFNFVFLKIGLCQSRTYKTILWIRLCCQKWPSCGVIKYLCNLALFYRCIHVDFLHLFLNISNLTCEVNHQLWSTGSYWRPCTVWKTFDWLINVFIFKRKLRATWPFLEEVTELHLFNSFHSSNLFFIFTLLTVKRVQRL